MSSPEGHAHRSAFRFVLLIGVVSLFSDMTHEGARSITGPFLGSLGASAAVIAGVAGFGELLGYALRSVVGLVADRTGRYWPITLAGYSVQMVAVPALALAGGWAVAALLIAAERTGRAVRTPVRDAMLAHATGELGRGWVFGVREALDAAGAMVGPLIVAGVLYAGHGFRLGFAVLAVPALLTIAVLLTARRQYPRPGDLEGDPDGGADAHGGAGGDRRGFPSRFWVYALAMGLVALGYADFPLIAFHLGTAHVVAGDLIPVLYAGAMAAEAVAALVLGRLFDRFGMLAVVGATAVTAAFAPLVFLGDAALAVLGLLCWGLGAAVQESIVRAAVTDMVDRGRRASAYGVFDTAFGVFWFAGSLALGVLYDRSVSGAVVFSVVVQAAALPLLLKVRRMGRTRTA